MRDGGWLIIQTVESVPVEKADVSTCHSGLLLQEL